MKDLLRRFGFLVGFAAGFTCAQPAHAGGLLYAFGDSLVDNGNIPKITGVSYPPAPFYVGNRFSNGPVYSEYLPGLLGLQSRNGPVYGSGTNFGVGGAFSGTGNLDAALFPGLPGLSNEIDLFQNSGHRFRSADVVTVWAGANDYFALLGAGAGSLTPDRVTNGVIQTTDNLAGAADRLARLGAQKLVFINLPDLGRIPLTAGNPAVSSAASAISSAHDSELESKLARVHSVTGANIFLLNADTVFREVFARPDRYGFLNVTDPANQSPLLFAPTSRQNTYLFWDNVHPTTAAHLILARYAANLVLAPDTLSAQTNLMTYATRALGDLLYAELGPRPLAEMPAPSPSSGSADGKAVSGKGVTPGPNVITTGSEGNFSIYLLGDYRTGHREDRTDSTGFDYDTGNVAIGTSYRFNPLVSAGLLFAYGRNHAGLNDDQGKIDVDAYQVGGFLDFHGRNWFAGVIAAYGYDDYDQKRPGILGDSIGGQPNGQTFLAGGRTGYVCRFGGLSLGPVASLTFTSANVEGYSETGDPVITQTVRSRTQYDLFGNIGLKASYDLRVSRALLQPYVRSEYEHEFLGDGTKVKTSFTSAPALELETRPADSSQNYFRLGAGIDAKFNERVGAKVGFEAVTGRSDGHEYTVEGGFSIVF